MTTGACLWLKAITEGEVHNGSKSCLSRLQISFCYVAKKRQKHSAEMIIPGPQAEGVP